jgi:hypothetical protein
MNVNTSRVAGADRASAIKTSARQQIEGVRANKTLSALGRRDAIRDIHTDTQRQLANLKADVERAPKQRREFLESVLFGASAVTGSEAISARDAYLRASQIKDHDEAAQLMEVARLSGDTVLAKAVAQVAVKHVWIDVLEVHANGDTYLEDRYSELLQINGELADTGTETQRVAAEMARQLVFNLEQPHELTGPSPVDVP